MPAERPPASRIAVIGVGLIGGSVGLAARERIDAIEAVAGWGSRPATLEKALELGAITRIASSVEDAVSDAELVLLCGPVSKLVDSARAVLAAAGDDCVVTDVGSTKRQIVSALDDPRFIGSHPIAGAETSGVGHARADLFEDATWFVTPTERTTGLGLETLLRFIRSLGARPHVMDAETHDKLLADISHLPHVLANALVTQAAASLNDSDRSVSVFGPSFRDATRVAGANSDIWRDIYLTNQDALVPAIDSVIGRLREFRDALASGDGEEIVRLNEAARSDRQGLLERDLVGGEACELRVSVPNQPGILAQITLALGRAGVNIVDMALYPAADMKSGAVSLWVGGDDAATRTEELIAELGFPVARA